MNKICVIGAGKFGTALAFACGKSLSNSVTIVSRRSDVVQKINYNGQHPEFLGINLHVAATNESLSGVKDADYIFIAVPSFVMVEGIKQIKNGVKNGVRIIICTKGINHDENETFYSDVLQRMIPHAKTLVLSGPSFADEIMLGVNTSVSIGASDMDTAKEVVNLFHGSPITAYPVLGLYGMQLLSACKNVIAIRIGIEEGFIKRFAEHMRRIELVDAYRNKISGLFVDLLHESAEILMVSGISKDIIISYYGIGDILLTTTSNKSRNRHFGCLLGEEVFRIALASTNGSMEDIEQDFAKNLSFVNGFVWYGSSILESIEKKEPFANVVEGYYGSLGLHRYAQKRGLDLPHFGMIYRMLHETK